MSIVDAEVTSVPVVFVPTPISFPETVERLELIKADYLKLKATDLTDKESEKVIHAALKHAMELRLKIEECRVEAKEPSLKHGRQVDAVAKELTAAISPAEDHLRIEDKKFKAEADRQKKIKDEAKAAATQARVDALNAVGDDITFVLAGALEPEAYEERLAASTAAHADKLAKEAAEEAEKQRLIAEAEQARKEQLAAMEAQRIENERLAAELKQQQEKLAAEQRAIEERNRAEYERIAAESRALEEAKAAAEKRVADAEAEKQRQVELEAAKKQAVADAKLKTEKEAAAKLEREKKAEAKRLRIEAAKPDQERVTNFADLLAEMELPKLNDEEAMALLKTVWTDAVQSVRDVVTGFDWEGQE